MGTNFINFIPFQILFVLANGLFVPAPGILKFTIRHVEVVGSCYTVEDKCSFNLDICLGTGKSEFERCILLSPKLFKGQISLDLAPYPKFNVPVDNIRSLFYLSANYTINRPGEDVIYLNYTNTIQFIGNKSKTMEIYSKNEFNVMTMDISVDCDIPYYPPYNCTIMCFNQPPINRCDNNGNKICYQGYTFSKEDNECYKDRCTEQPNFCENGGKCVNEEVSVSCACAKYYSGLTCEKWDPCVSNQCQNNAGCVPLIKSNLLSSTNDKYFLPYICICKQNYWGNLCEKSIDVDDNRLPCRQIMCTANQECKIENNLGKCKDKPTPTLVKSIAIITTTLKSIKNDQPQMDQTLIIPELVGNMNMKPRELIKLIQHPFQNSYTIIAVVIVILVFIVGMFAVSYWIVKIKYFHNKNKFISFGFHNSSSIQPAIGVSHPILNNTLTTNPINGPHHFGGHNSLNLDSFRRCHSLDDSSFYLSPNNGIYHDDINYNTYVSSTNYPFFVDDSAYTQRKCSLNYGAQGRFTLHNSLRQHCNQSGHHNNNNHNHNSQIYSNPFTLPTTIDDRHTNNNDFIDPNLEIINSNSDSLNINAQSHLDNTDNNLINDV